MAVGSPCVCCGRISRGHGNEQRRGEDAKTGDPTQAAFIGHGVNTPYPTPKNAIRISTVIQYSPRCCLILPVGVRPRAAGASANRHVALHPGRRPSRNRRARSRSALGKALVVCAALSALGAGALRAAAGGTNGVASWYGEEHRGKFMANGKRFNPDKLTAASWFYPLGTKVRVSLASPAKPRRSVVVTITDRGPSKELVRNGRIIDLSHATFKRLAPPSRALWPLPCNGCGSNPASVSRSLRPPLHFRPRAGSKISNCNRPKGGLHTC